MAVFCPLFSVCFRAWGFGNGLRVEGLGSGFKPLSFSASLADIKSGFIGGWFWVASTALQPSGSSDYWFRHSLVKQGTGVHYIFFYLCRGI